MSARSTRLTIAHELAHTLFFDTSRWPPTPLVPLDSRESRFERLCWYIARCILCPADWLRQDPSLQVKEGSPSNILEVVFNLARLYEVSGQVLSCRIIEDLALSSYIVLNFIRRQEAGTAETPLWRLNWQALPNNTKGLWVPLPNV